MSETRSPTEALLNFAKWMEPLEGYKSVQRIYGLTAADAHAVLAQLAAESKRADEATEALDKNWVTHQRVIAANQRAAAAEARATGLQWVEADERLPTFGSYALCQFASEILGAGVGVCQLVGNEFMSEWIFAGRFSVYVKKWMDVDALLSAGEEAKDAS